PATGQLGVIFYDRRDDPSNVQARAYMATSFDGGLTWEDFPVADVAFTPTSIPGLATGYMGDYLGLAINSGQAYPSWMDTRTGNFLCYVSPTLIADPTRPNPPTDVASYSDYQTPNSVLLNWTDPTTFPDGTPLVDFSIDILRDGLLVTNVDQGNGTYTDLGLTDGQLYDYELRTRDDVTDSLSTVVPTSVICGGSPDPGPVSAVSCAGDLTTATIDWTNPTLQADGTPLDDFAGVRIYRNGSLLVELGRAPADTGNAEQYVDTPTPGFVYDYELAAIDSETPVHESARVATGACFVGDVPDILVWKPAGLASPSADSLFAALVSLGESVVLSTDLFEFGADLNVHDMVFATAGVSPDRHVITPTEGAALDSFVQDGGMLYLEGGDCFNDESGGYNVRAIFGLNDGPSGTADLFGVTGLNDALGLAFAYSGPNNNMDELSPVSSTPIFQNSANTDRSGVFAPSYGLGRAIGVTFEFRGLVAGAATPTDLVARYLAMFRSTGTPTLFVGPTSIASSVYQNETDLQTAIVGNPGTLNASLTWSLTEAPDVPWLAVTPSAGTIPANGQTTLNLSLDATGLLPNLYTTNVVVTSNDPSNSADTIAVAFDVAGIPILDVSPPMLDVSIAINDAVTDSLVFGNTGTDDLVFSLDTPGGGGVERDEFLAEDVTNTSSNARRGNVHQVTTGLVINQFEHNLTVVSPTTLEFFVYESETSTGTYTKKYSTTVAAAAGSGWYSSGPINAALLPGYFYFIGCGWQGAVTATRDNAQNAPEGTSFGSILGSAAISGFPPPATQFIGQVNPAIWDQALEFGFPLDVTLQTAAAGTIAPGSTHTARLNFAAGTTLGEWTTVLTLSHNIPNLAPVLQIPIHMTVLDGTLVDSPVQIGVPIAFALHRASPNPSSDRTLIRFDLPHAARVKLDVFDVTGRRVRTLVDGPVEPGYRNVLWDGRDSGGRAVASGVYFYALESEGHSFREKVVLLH
ncbi:MAG: T9SS type A sorting domain-containing protein, partial [Gemmatimonadetes bacterium]|nr:T9SS type A sorting domain-containing protein [Gemmatimonadota bacterium]